MATVFSDDLAGTATDDLSTSVPEVGTGWTKHADSSTRALQLDGSGYAAVSANASFNNRWVYYTDAVPGPDYYVECVMRRRATAGGSSPGFAFRFQSASGNCYFVSWNRDLGNGWQLRKRVAGTETQIGSTFTDNWGNNTDRTVRIVGAGSNLEVFIGGVSRITGTDSDITAAGAAGLIWQQVGGSITPPADTIYDSLLIDYAAPAPPSGNGPRSMYYQLIGAR